MDNNTIKSNLYRYSTTFIKDPSGTKYLACLHDFNTEEMIDGYEVQDLEFMISYLLMVKEELKVRNTFLNTPPLYNGILE